MNLFINLLFGHIIGDYFLQNTWMAMNKSASTFKCAVHCFLYTLSICCFTSFHWSWVLFVFCSHFVVDRFNLADKYLKLIHSRSLKNYYEHGEQDIPPAQVKNRIKRTNMGWNYRILRGGFTSIVYVIVDNSIHLMSMYYLYSYLT